ncbi:hypothetical protein [Streptomyces hyaluromycini]|uniref:hypothetical protein n=1 Tax=Streptomyces hyaluromycini TaxID=1377993 RepID=UPI0011AE8F0C|nr:hypothetical protein [Streptomyces hyaluromycini]
MADNNKRGKGRLQDRYPVFRSRVADMGNWVSGDQFVKTLAEGPLAGGLALRGFARKGETAGELLFSPEGGAATCKQWVPIPVGSVQVQDLGPGQCPGVDSRRVVLRFQVKSKAQETVALANLLALRSGDGQPPPVNQMTMSAQMVQAVIPQTLSVGPTTVDLGNGHYMVSDAEVNISSLQGTCNVHLTCTNKLIGFTGGVKLLFFDEHGTKLGESPTQSYGIDPQIFGAAHRNEQFSFAAAPGTAVVVLSQFWAPKNRFGDILNGIESAVSEVVVFAEWVLHFCDNFPDLCGSVNNSSSGEPADGSI